MASPSDTKDAITHVEQAPQPTTVNTTTIPHNVDTAAKFLASAHVQDASFTYSEERSVLRRIDARVLPLLLGAYFFQQLDKSSLSYVSIFGLQKDAHLVGRQYSWLGSILYLAQLVMQPLAAFILVKLPTGKVIATAILLWGATLAVMASCRGPMKAKYLTEREKVIAVERLRANQMGIQSGHWRWDQVWETFLDFKTWCWFVAIVAISIASGGISTFGNLIIKDFGYTNFQSILFNIPFGFIQIVAILGSSLFATRFKRKGLTIALVAILPILGTILMLTVPRNSHNKGVLLFGYYLVSCLAAITPIIYAWHVQNTAGDTKKKCTSAMVFIGMCTGNVIGPLLYSLDDAPLYRPGLISNLVMFVLVALVALAIPVYLKVLNGRHERRREELGKSRVRVDESMLKKGEIGVAKEVEMEGGGGGGGGEQRAVLDNGFADLTDIQNEDFIYVY
ncbi:hypothetical protein N0V83_008061 [Neocucurbitaria cava]|uniref:Allantoate permease n=1 Tax=Neocucurbitaria cava TaxID=798079 RepID=A0A9W8Y2Y2_9PLEO|nr:hypothetical protein N0V83_008061 [Neocucurbitaria cava]